MKTWGQIKASSIAGEIRLAPCSPEFLVLMNEVQEQLAQAGRWWGTTRRLRICVTSGCITWPQEVLTPHQFSFCGLAVPLRNEWFEFMEDVPMPRPGETCADTRLIDRGFTVQFRDAPSVGKIRLYCGSATDAGKRVLLQGSDQNGIPIRSQDGATWVDGEMVVLAQPFATSVNSFVPPGLGGVRFESETNDRVMAYSVDPSSLVETQVAIWSPGELLPQFRRSYLFNTPTSSDTQCTDVGDGCRAALSCSNVVAEAICSLQFRPVRVDSDLMFIGNFAALLHGAKARRRSQAEREDLAASSWGQAFQALRDEMRRMSPPEQIRVNPQKQGLDCIFRGFI